MRSVSKRLLKMLQLSSFCPTLACTTPVMEQLRERRQLQTMGGGVGGRRVQPRRAGGRSEIIIYGVRDFRFSDLVTGDILRKKYLMLTKFYLYVHKGAAEFLYRKMTVATYLGFGASLTI